MRRNARKARPHALVRCRDASPWLQSKQWADTIRLPTISSMSEAVRHVTERAVTSQEEQLDVIRGRQDGRFCHASMQRARPNLAAHRVQNSAVDDRLRSLYGACGRPRGVIGQPAPSAHAQAGQQCQRLCRDTLRKWAKATSQRRERFETRLYQLGRFKSERFCGFNEGRVQRHGPRANPVRRLLLCEVRTFRPEPGEEIGARLVVAAQSLVPNGF